MVVVVSEEMSNVVERVGDVVQAVFWKHSPFTRR